MQIFSRFILEKYYDKLYQIRSIETRGEVITRGSLKELSPFLCCPNSPQFNKKPTTV
jgi:hypothetical protein